MPSAAPPRLVLPQGRAAMVAALLSAVLAGGLMLPQRLRCALSDAGEACADDPLFGLMTWLGLSLLLWGLWAAALLSRRWLPRRRQRRRWGLGLQIAALSLAGALGEGVHGLLSGDGFGLSPYGLQVQLTFAACVCLALEFHQRGRRREADAESLRQREAVLARQLDAARAQLLQAQVEPHFLFNTLAHLRRLAQTHPAGARAMLDDLRCYLEAALPELRQAETPLARELALVSAFLALHQRRTGAARLRLRYEVAPGLDDAVVPSTCLLTLAENAIKHGIAPRVEGGEICVRAGPDPQHPGRLRLEVADTGAGMSTTSGGGTGLSTLRGRLAAMFGAQAHLSLHLNQPQGLIARLQLPWR